MKRSLVLVSVCLSLTQAWGGGIGVAPQSGSAVEYSTGFKSLASFSTDLVDSLKDEARKGLALSPLDLAPHATPLLAPGRLEEGNLTLDTIRISPAMIELINRVAHAHAVNEFQRGYLKSYLKNLAQSNEAADLPPVTGKKQSRVWAFETMNAQMTAFNEMAGTLVAIDLAHHYLGHYRKYAARLQDSAHPVAINTLVTDAEWQQAMEAGVKSAMECGLSTEGYSNLLDAVERMERRPAWAAYVMPAQGKVGKMRRDLAKWNKKFFDTSEGESSVQLLGSR